MTTTIEIDSYQRYLQIAASFASVKLGLLLVRHPLLVIQTCKQANPDLSNRNIVVNTYRNEGIRGFYRSTSLSILKICLTESYRGILMIAVPKKIKASLWLPEDPLKEALALAILATSIISTIDAFMICPIMRLSTMQITGQKPMAMKQLFQEKKPLSLLYRGYTPLWLQTALLWGNFLIVDDLMKAFLKKQGYKPSYASLMLSSMIGGTMQAFLGVIPEAIRVQMQKEGARPLPMRLVTKELIRRHGVCALFYGIPHKLANHIISYSYKSLLRHFWTQERVKPQ